MESTSSDKNVHSVKSDPKFVSDGSAITSHGVLSSSSTLVDTRSLISGSRPANVPLVVSGQGSNPALASVSSTIAVLGSEHMSATAEATVVTTHQSNVTSHPNVSATTTAQSSLLMSNYCSGAAYSGSPNFCTNQGIIFSAPNITPFGLFRNSGFFSGPISSNGQPQAIILNHFGQPLGIGSQQTVFAVPFTPTSQPPSSESIGGASGAGSSKPLAQQPPSTPIHQPPLVMAYRAPSVQHPVASQLSNFNVSNTTHQLPLFPNVGSNATSALAAVSAFNAPILLPTGQMVFRTPHGQLIGFQVPALNRNGICTDPSTAAAAGVTASHFSAKFPLPKTYSNSVPLASHSAQHSTTLNHGVSKHSVSSGKSHAHADPRDTAEAKAVAAAIVAATAAKAATISSTKVSSTKDVKSDSAAPEKTVDKMSKQRSCDASSVVPEAVLNGTMGVETTELEKRTQPQPSRPVTPPRGSPLSPFLSPKELIDEGSQKFTVTVDSDIHAMFLQQLEEYAKSAKPQVLNHLVDGFIIQESVEPFPFSSYPFEDFSLLETESLDTCLLPPLLTPEQTSDTSSSSPTLAKIDSDAKSTGYSPEVSSTTMQGSQVSPKVMDDADMNISSRSGDQELMVSPSHWKRGRLDTVSSDNSFSYQSSSVISKTAVAKPDLVAETYLDKNPAEWTVQEVQMWLSSLGPGVAQYCNTFQQQEIDGQALLLLHEDHLVRTMGLKLGPAVKVCAALKILRG